MPITPTITPSDEKRRRARRLIIRSVLAWLPLFVLFVGGAVFFLVRALTDDAGAWVGFAILGLVALLTLPLAASGLQDLRADPIETEGPLARKWSKADFFVIRAHYFLIGKRVFRIDKGTWISMPDVPGRVHLLHYPHTNTLIDWQPAEEALADADDARTPAARRWVPTPAPLTRTRARPLAEAVQPPTFGEAFRPSTQDSAADAPWRLSARQTGPPPAQPERVEPPRFGPPRKTEAGAEPSHPDKSPPDRDRGA